MALINCYECAAEISDQASACPRCGASQSRAAKKRAEATAKQRAYAQYLQTPEGKKERKRKLTFVAAGATVLFVWWIARDGGKEPTTPQPAVADAPVKPALPPEMTATEALLLCQKAFRQISRDPENAKVPYVKDQGRGSESYFAWGASTKMMRMRNGLGLEVATTGSCIVDRTKHQITSLTVDGKSAL